MTTWWFKRLLAISVLLVGSCVPLQQKQGSNAGLHPVDLRCEYLTGPLAVDVTQPRLSWRLETDAPQARAQCQQAYRLLVASTPELLQQQHADLWDSGRVTSNRCLHVEYRGLPLRSRQLCYWQVQIWDQNGRASAWSTMASWRMGLLAATDWGNAQWLTLDQDTRNTPFAERPFQTEGMKEPRSVRSHASSWFRTDVTLDKPVKTALAYVCGLGYAELYVNGQRISDHVLDPGQTTYDVRSLYVTHEITEALRSGENALGLWLGNGFYGQNVAFTPGLQYGPPCGTAQFWIEYQDGTTETIITDDQWKAHVSAVVFDNVYAGETYDARLEQSGWNQPGFDDAAWQKAKILDPPTARLESQMMPPIRRTKTLTPVAVTEGEDNTWIVDLGQNIAGWLRVTVDEPAGTAVTITYGEHLLPSEGRVDTASTGHFATGVLQQDIYICKGMGLETWEPRFTYQGFRYAQIEGLSRAPTFESITGVLVHTDVEKRGSFTCSNPLINQMVDVSLWTIVDNLHSVPEDCPHREKCGWTGDAHLTAEAEIFHFDMARFFTKYLRDIKSVLGRGRLTYITRQETDAMVPAMIAPGKRLCLEATADWGVAIVLLPWYLHTYYGDQAVLEEFYPHMKTWAEYEWTRVQDGLLQHGLGDWCPPAWDRKDNPAGMECDPNVSATALYLEALHLLTEISRDQADPDFTVWCQRHRRELLRTFNKKLLQPVEGTQALTYGSQTANAMALRFRLAPSAQQRDVVQGLVHDINERHQGHHSCGVFGLKHLFTVLCDQGQADLAFEVMTVPSFPSPAYPLSRGLTTWPERQFEWPEGEPFDNRSYNHPFQGAFITTFHEAVAGIRPDPAKPGFKHIIMKPILPKQLSWAQAEHQSPYGLISSRWSRTDHVLQWDVTIPPNTTATLYIPCASLEDITESGVPLSEAAGLSLMGQRSGRTVVRAGSGRYSFRSSL